MLEKKKFVKKKIQQEIEKERIKERIRLDRELQKEEARRRAEEEEAAKKSQKPHLDEGVLSWSAPIKPTITPQVKSSADDIDEEIQLYKSGGNSIAVTASSSEKSNFSTLGSISSKKKKKKKMNGLYQIFLNIIKKVVKIY